MKKAKPSGSVNQPRQMRPALTPESRENQMISLAMDLAEKQLREGTASSQLITEFVKRGSTKAKLEKEMMAEQKELLTAKREALAAAAHVDELYQKALNAFRGYSGQEVDDDETDY